MTKDEKLYLKYKNKFSFIFEDKYLSDSMKNHFDKNGSLVMFLIAIMQSKTNDEKILNHLKINKDEWCELFSHLYSDNSIIELYKKLEINPIVPLEHTIQSFECFNKFINEFLQFIKNHEINLNISDEDLKKLILSVYGYLLYNKIECKIPYNITDILCDKDYDTKLQTILNNTKLFAKAKQEILNHFQDKINDLIVLLLGMNQSLNKD